ncbi:MAG: hypothetical protein JSW06_02965 [Thermoplasmatales archaeon]|nr:MAG: hypothetical protein JSW06_02965 [Thermoplasmatales archaeon]
MEKIIRTHNGFITILDKEVIRENKKHEIEIDIWFTNSKDKTSTVLNFRDIYELENALVQIDEVFNKLLEKEENASKDTGKRNE